MSEQLATDGGTPKLVKCPNCIAGRSATYEALSKHVNKLVWDRAVGSDPYYRAVTNYLCDTNRVAHDSIDAWVATKKLGELAGLPDGWHLCEVCKGEGELVSDAEGRQKWVDGMVGDLLTPED